jgi:hypothetical protein
MAQSVTAEVGQMLHERITRIGPAPSVDHLTRFLRILGMWRSQMLANTYVARQGGKIHQGLFAGMEYLTRAAEGALMPRLLGTYEDELHPYIRAFAAQGLDCVIDVGCAEGYYAVGLARLMPEVTVHAYDISEQARKACATLAAHNGVTDRVTIGAEFTPEGFEAFAGRRVLVWLDAEGAEDDLLRPDISPSLARMNLIVETHEMFRPGVLDRLMERFSPTHDIVRVDQQSKVVDMPGWMKDLSHMDQLMAVWEWRLGPTPWLVMTPKTKP